MKMIFNRRAIALTALIYACGAYAQENLKQEITVTHHEEVKPTDAVKLNITPTVTMPALPTSRLNYGTRQVTVDVPASISSLAPAAYADTIYRSPFRGYAAAGYLPAFNLAASAGYKFIDNDRIRLNGWMQYDGVSYRADMPWQSSPFSSVRLRRNTATVGASLHSAVGNDSYLDLGIDYTFARFNTPAFQSDGVTAGSWMKDQNVHRFNISGLWTMTTGKWDTGLGLAYGHFAYANVIPAVMAHNTESISPLADIKSPFLPARENRFSLRAFASAKVWGAQSAGMEVRLSYLNYGNHARYMPVTQRFVAEGSDSHALLSLRPFYRTDWKHIVLDLGVNVDFTFNNGKAFHISPAAQATWKPSNFVTMYVKANGGERQNTLGSLFDVTHYGLPNLAYDNSHIVADGEIGVTVGAYKGFYSQISAGYAIANDWLMPECLEGFATMFNKINMKGYKFHIGAGYRYRTIADISASLEMAPRKYNRGYYLWRDRARYVAGAKLRVTPIEPLDINLSWDYRAGRRMYTVPTASLEATPLHLGTVNSLSLGGAYRLTGQWTIWADIENILNHHHALIGGIPSQGINGLVGATYKF